MDSGAIRLARDALATPDLRRLQLAAAAAGVGGWAFMVSLAVHAYAVGGAAAVGLAALVRMAPAGPRRAADRAWRRTASRAATCCSRRRSPARCCSAPPRSPSRSTARSRCCSCWRRCSRSPRPRTSPPRPRCCRGSRRTAPARPRPTRSGPRSTAARSCVGAIARRRARGRLRRRRGVRGQRRSRSWRPALALARIARDSAPGGHRERVAAPKRRASRPRDVARAARDAARGPARRRARPAAAAAGRRALGLSTFVEGMVDVLVVVTALSLVDLGDAGVGWLNAAWGIGGLAGGARRAAAARARPARPRAARRRRADRRCRCSLLAALPSAPRRSLALLVLGVGYALVESAGHHADAAPRARRRPRPRVRRRRELLLADDGRGRDARAAR